MACSTPVFKPLSMADFTLSTPKPSYPFLTIPSKPIKLIHISASSTFPSWFSVKTKLSISNRSVMALVTSDWVQPETEEAEAAVSEWEGEGEEQNEESVGDRFAEEEEGEESYPEPPEEAKLFVGNLPFDVDSEKLAQMFEKAGIVEVAEVIYNRETDQSRGFGFVTMSTVEEAEKAVDMLNRYDVNGRLLTVNKAAPRGSRPERAPRGFESSLRIYVGNLPWQVDDARLEQMFSEHGKVVDARVVFDRDTGRSRGFGFVTMSSQTDLDDAIAALDGQSLDGRAIRVNLAEERPRRGAF